MLESSERGVRKYSRIRTDVLPQRFVGDTNTMNGEMSPASIVQACRTQSAKPMSASFGRTIYRRNIRVMESRSARGGHLSCVIYLTEAQKMLMR